METGLEVLRMCFERINMNLDEAIEGDVNAYSRILTSLAAGRGEIKRLEDKLNDNVSRETLDGKGD